MTAALSNLAGIHLQLGQFYRAVDYMSDVIARNEAELAANHPDAAVDWYTYGRLLGYIGRYDEAIDALERSTKICREVYGDDHPYTAWSLTSLAKNKARNGVYADAEQIIERAVEIRLQSSEKPHSSIAETQLAYAWVLLELGRGDEAEAVIGDAAQQLAHLVGTEDVEYLYSQLLLARLRLDQGRAAQGLETLAPVIANDETNPLLDTASIVHSRLLRRLARFSEAEQVARAAIGELESARGRNYPRVADAQLELAMVLIDAGNPRQAIVFAERAADGYRAALPSDHWKNAAAAAIRIEAASLADADPARIEGLETHAAILTSTLPSSNEFVRRLVHLRNRLNSAETANNPQQRL